MLDILKNGRNLPDDNTFMNCILDVQNSQSIEIKSYLNLNLFKKASFFLNNHLKTLLENKLIFLSIEDIFEINTLIVNLQIVDSGNTLLPKSVLTLNFSLFSHRIFYCLNSNLIYQIFEEIQSAHSEKFYLFAKAVLNNEDFIAHYLNNPLIGIYGPNFLIESLHGENINKNLLNEIYLLICISYTNNAIYYEDLNINEVIKSLKFFLFMENFISFFDKIKKIKIDIINIIDFYLNIHKLFIFKHEIKLFLKNDILNILNKNKNLLVVKIFLEMNLNLHEADFLYNPVKLVNYFLKDYSNISIMDENEYYYKLNNRNYNTINERILSEYIEILVDKYENFLKKLKESYNGTINDYYTKITNFKIAIGGGKDKINLKEFIFDSDKILFLENSYFLKSVNMNDEIVKNIKAFFFDITKKNPNFKEINKNFFFKQSNFCYYLIYIMNIEKDSLYINDFRSKIFHNIYDHNLFIFILKCCLYLHKNPETKFLAKFNETSQNYPFAVNLKGIALIENFNISNLAIAWDFFIHNKFTSDFYFSKNDEITIINMLKAFRLVPGNYNKKIKFIFKKKFINTYILYIMNEPYRKKVKKFQNLIQNNIYDNMLFLELLDDIKNILKKSPKLSRNNQKNK